MSSKRHWLSRLENQERLSLDEYTEILSAYRDASFCEALFEKARKTSLQNFGNKVYPRGLIEISSFCKNDCLYCGIRCGNKNAQRYRLSDQQILAACASGYKLGFRTFVLQGGEDGQLTDQRLVPIILQIKLRHPDCALTLSLGERSRSSYQALFDAGADRYLLRHEAADPQLYSSLHPPQMRLDTRLRALQDLKEIGYQVGCGFMVGPPGQTDRHLAQDLLFLRDFQPHMVGVGPFVPHRDTVFRNQMAGSVPKTLFLLALVRLLLPRVLLPATTALGTVAGDGRERGVLAGANVVMPNLSPADVREKYALYDNKLSSGAESAEQLGRLALKMQSIGYTLALERGDHPDTKSS